jgi:hypothetical protein
VLDSAAVIRYRLKMESSGDPFFFPEPEENSEEYAHFYFIGTWKEQEVVFDAALCTLRLQHENDLYQLAEEKAERQFPRFRKSNASGIALPEAEEEEIGMFLAEVIEDLLEEDQVKVKEFVDLDPEHEFGVSLDAALNVDKIDSGILRKFITDFTTGQLRLDPTLYSFQEDDEEE